MRIIVLSINYAPELTGIGKYTGEMAAWLVAHGHEVRAVTAPPYYPAWTVGAGYSSNSWHREHLSGVDIWRCPLWIPQQPGGTKRVLHLLSFTLSSLPVMLRQIFWQPDVILILEPPLSCAPTALVVAKLAGARTWLHIQDFEVDAAFDLGMLRGQWVKRVVAAAESWLMRRFDVVSTISQRMLARAQAKGVEADQLVLFPNWVDVAAITPGVAVQSDCGSDAQVASASSSAANYFRLQLGIAADAVVALYAGNMGAKQGLELLADTAKLCLDQAKQTNAIMFVFCGNGAGRADLLQRCDGIANVHFLDLQPIELLPILLAIADIHLLPQRADAADLVMPSKLTGMFASARPVIATANLGTELAQVVQGCGLVVPPEDPQALADAIFKLAADAALRKQLGNAGRAYAVQHMDRDAVLKSFEAKLLTLKVNRLKK